MLFIMYKHFDFIAIGDITTDAFIKLKKENAEIICDLHGRKCKIVMSFGDKIEYESVQDVYAVGNSPNAATSAARLGLISALVTNIGDDDLGKKCLETLSANGIATDFVAVHAGKKSNYHFVLMYEEERTILIKHEDYPYTLPDMGEPSWVYLSSLGPTSLPFHQKLAAYLSAHPSVKLSFQPGTFQIQLGYEPLKDVYANSALFFCNVEECQRILKTTDADIKKLLASTRALGVKIPVITDGPRGAYAMDENGDVWHMPMYPDPAPPVSRTGAGDAFASTFTSMLALGKSVPEALKRAPVNSAAVVQKVGAQAGLLTLDELEAWLAKAPPEYVAKKI